MARGLDARDGVRPGDEAQVLSPSGDPLGRGLADPGSPIAVRMWTRGRDPADGALFRARAERACALRELLFSGSSASGGSGLTNAYRVVHGEGDRMPGFVIDRYGPVAIARADGDAVGARMGELADAAWPPLQRLGVTALFYRTGGRGETPRLDRLHGEAPADDLRRLEVQEHGVRFVVDVEMGQKTGAFLDQRDNRRRVGELARGRRVLNLFSYAGGFSLHAALGGATHVTSVDVAAAAHATAQASLRASGVDPGAHAFVTADVRAFLEGARTRREAWDLIVSDPPSFAPSERAVAKALAAYRGLHQACAAVLAPGGLFCASSCSSHVDAATFLETFDDAALGRADLSVLEVRGAGPDHPTLAGFPEGRYLKFVVLG